MSQMSRLFHRGSLLVAWGSLLVLVTVLMLFGQFEFRATEQAHTYLKFCVLISHSTHIYPSLFDCPEYAYNFFYFFVIFKLLIRDFPQNMPLDHLQDLESYSGLY